uniref:Mitoregulin n=5 Tax=Pseudocrenilabrinae TaxID=318546 RepID=A0A3Q2VJN6_HAPBU
MTGRKYDFFFPLRLQCSMRQSEFNKPRTTGCSPKQILPLQSLHFTTYLLANFTSTEVNMADVSERTLQVAVVVSFAAGFLAGWQANRMRRRFLDWRKKRLQEKLSETQKKLDLA